jgi:hypothetical protein
MVEKTVMERQQPQKRKQTWKMLEEKILKAKIQVPRNAQTVGAKTAHMEGEYKKAFDFVTDTGQDLMEESKI